MSCIFACFNQRASARSSKTTSNISKPSARDIRAHKAECKENKKAFIQKYPNSKQAQDLQKPPVRTAQQIREDFLKGSEEFDNVVPPAIAMQTEHRRVSSEEAGLARAHAKAAKRIGMTALEASSESTVFIPRNKFENQQTIIKTKGETKYQEAVEHAARRFEQTERSRVRSETAGKIKPEKVLLDTRRYKSRPTRRGCLETKIGETIVQSAVILTPATIRTIALYPEAWDARKGAVDREGEPVKKITRKSSSFEKEPRSPLPPKSKSASSHSLQPGN